MKPNSKKTYQTNKELKIKTLKPQDAKTHSSVSRPLTSNLVKVRLDLKDLHQGGEVDTMLSNSESKPALTLYDGGTPANGGSSWINLRNRNKASTVVLATQQQVEPLQQQNLNSDLEPYMTWKDAQIQPQSQHNTNNK